MSHKKEYSQKTKDKLNTLANKLFDEADEQEFNINCAEFMGINIISSRNGYVCNTEPNKFHAWNPFSDANDRNKVLEKMMQLGYEFSYFMEGGEIGIEIAKSLSSVHSKAITRVFDESMDEAQIKAISAVLKEGG